MATMQEELSRDIWSWNGKHRAHCGNMNKRRGYIQFNNPYRMSTDHPEGTHWPEWMPILKMNV